MSVQAVRGAVISREKKDVTPVAKTPRSHYDATRKLPYL